MLAIGHKRAAALFTDLFIVGVFAIILVFTVGI